MAETGWLKVLLDWLSLPLLGVLAGVCVWRRVYRELPFFFSYVVAALLIGVLRLLAYKLGSPRGYFYVFWYSDFVSVMAALLAIYEVFLRKIFPSFYRVRFYRLLFPAAATIIAVLTFATAVAAPNRGQAFTMTSRAFDFLRSAVIGFFAGLTLLMGRQVAGKEFWVAAGFGLQAAVALCDSAMSARWPGMAKFLDTAELIAYNVSCLIWLMAFWKTETITKRASSDELDPRMLHQARAWETILKGWLLPGNKR